MTWEVVSNFINNFGFNALCVGAMGWYVKYITDRNYDTINRMTDAHKEETDSIKEALNNNTIALTRLLEKE